MTVKLPILVGPIPDAHPHSALKHLLTIIAGGQNFGDIGIVREAGLNQPQYKLFGGIQGDGRASYLDRPTPVRQRSSLRLFPPICWPTMFHVSALSKYAGMYTVHIHTLVRNTSSRLRPDILRTMRIQRISRSCRCHICHGLAAYVQRTIVDTLYSVGSTPYSLWSTEYASYGYDRKQR